jgi:hypothetical protein
MRLKAWFLATAVLFLAVPKSFAAGEYCKTYAGNSTYDVSTLKMATLQKPDSQANLFDYGVIFEEADDTDAACQDWASIALYKKVRSTLELPWYKDTNAYGTNSPYLGPYQGWLEGANATLVYATALRLGAKGKLTKPLAQLIDQIDYQANIEKSCGISSNRYGQSNVWANQNTCMDDWAVAASGYAWAAAWKSARNHSYTSVQGKANQAKGAIASAFDTGESICIHKPNATWPTPAPAAGPCTGTVADINAGTAIAMGLHNGDAMPYGFGLLTSIAAADVALNFTGFSHTYTADQKAIAKSLWMNADFHTTGTATSWEFKNDCYRFVRNPTTGAMTRTADFQCREPNYGGVGYQPEMFPLYEFFSRRLGGAPFLYMYDYTYFDEGLFCDNPSTCTDRFWSPGRRVIYGKLARDWVVSTPPLSADLGDYTIKLKTYDGVHYVSARNGGGAEIHAEATSGSWEETFSLVDVNGGLLMSGDQVYLQTMEGQYISAYNGGGSDVYAVYFQPLTWERFTIEKTWGYGQIYDGSPVAFRTLNNYYWSAINEGGGELLAPYLGVVTWEVFTIELTNN